LQDYIKENKLKILGEPIPNYDKHAGIDWENQKNFDFEYEIGLVDDFKLDIKSRKVKIYSIEVGEDEVDKTISNLQNQYGEMNNPEVSEKGDSLFGELKSEDASFSKDLLLEYEKVEKKLQEKMTGVKKEDLLEFDIKKAFKDVETCAEVLSILPAEARKLNGTFRFKVKNINRVMKSELNQDFFDKVFGKDRVTSQPEFLDKVKEEIAKGYERESERFLEQSIVDTLVDNTKINFPEEFLKKWLSVSNEAKVSKEDIDKEFPNYLKELKWSLIKKRITEENNIKVEHADVINKTKELIQAQFGMRISPELEKNMDNFADNYLKANEGENYMRIYNQLQSESIFSFLKTQFTLQEKKIKPKEFQKLVLGQQ
jgi:trigger factor